MKRFRSIVIWHVGLLAVGVVLFFGGRAGLQSLAPSEEALSEIKAIPLPSGVRSIEYTTQRDEELRPVEDVTTHGERLVGLRASYPRGGEVAVVTYLTKDNPASVLSFYKGVLGTEWSQGWDTSFKYIGFTRRQERFNGMNILFPAPTSPPWIGIDVDHVTVRSELIIRAYRVYLEQEGEAMTSVRVSLKTSPGR